ncbi:MAG: polysaccharide deacetylase family protein [Candidatus Omnitrophica bacterium]|nr:polysaccharide deacetylase family protein [Candidatus Omnitrophota bacterium]
MLMRLTMLTAITCLSCGLAARGETVAERLGYPADAKLLIIHGDDIGMCHSANASAVDALEKGIVTCGSVMVPCPWFLEIADYSRRHPEADLGLHLTHTSEWKYYRWRPLAPLAMVKGLLDAEGYMHGGVRDVYGSASVQEVEAEMCAQIEFALQHGMKPTHLDSHMGTLYYNPEYLQMALRVSEEYDIPLMFFKAKEPFLQKLPEASRDAFVQLSDSMERRGIPLLDAMPSIGDVSVDEMDGAYRKLIQNIQPGLSLVILHLADESKEYQRITGSYPKRLAEYRIFTDPAMKALIDEEGVRLIGWKDLLPLWKQRAPAGP